MQLQPENRRKEETVAFPESPRYRRDVSEIFRELKKVDTKIEEELARSRQALSPLLEEREAIVRGGLKPTDLLTGQADLILALATTRAPAGFTMSEAYCHVRDNLGPTVKPNQVSAWLTKLTKRGKLIKRKRGFYALP